MKTTEIRTALLQIGFDTVRFQRNGTWSLKWGYYYRSGVTPELLWNKVKHSFPHASLVKAEDRWKAFPRDSYMLVEFTLPIQEGVTA